MSGIQLLYCQRHLLLHLAMQQTVLNLGFLYRFPNSNYDPIHISVLVDLGLSKAVDLLSTVLNLAVGCLEATQNARALLDVVVAHQLVVCNAVESTVAWKMCVSIVLRDFQVFHLHAAGPPGTHLPAAPLTVQASCFKDWLGIQQAPLAAWRFSSSLRGVLRTPSTSVIAAEEMATRPKRTAVMENCILAI